MGDNECYIVPLEKTLSPLFLAGTKLCVHIWRPIGAGTFTVNGGASVQIRFATFMYTNLEEARNKYLSE